MIVLEPGLNNLKMGEVYALPSYPCQIFCHGFALQLAPNYEYILETAEEPGAFFNGGLIRCLEQNVTLSLKKHIISSQPTASNYSAKVLLDNPSYYWRLNEPSGTTARERIQGARGTISGGVTLAQPGALSNDKAMVFDGVSGKIVTGQSITIPVVCSVECWFKFTAVGAYQVFVSNRDTGHPNGPALFGLASNRLAVYSDGAVPIQVTNANPLVANTWYHAVFVRSATSIKFYLNGQFDSEAAQAPQVPTVGTIGLGSDATQTSNLFGGSLDEIAIYPYALSPTQILAHYNARSPYAPNSYATKVIASGPSAYWRLGELSGTTAVDQIGGFNGTISGGVTLGQPGALADGNTAMQFNGTSGKIQTAQNVPVVPPCTIEAWIRTTSPGDKPYFTSNIVTAANDLIYAGMTTNNLRSFIVHASGGVSDLISIKIINDNQWHHVAITYTVLMVTLYVDGVVDRSGAPIKSLVGATNQPGEVGWNSNYVHAWQGLIDEVAIYPRALSPAEILDHYKAR